MHSWMKGRWRRARSTASTEEVSIAIFPSRSRYKPRLHADWRFQARPPASRRKQCIDRKAKIPPPRRTFISWTRGNRHTCRARALESGVQFTERGERRSPRLPQLNNFDETKFADTCMVHPAPVVASPCARDRNLLCKCIIKCPPSCRLADQITSAMLSKHSRRVITDHP